MISPNEIDNFLDTSKANCRGKDVTIFYPPAPNISHKSTTQSTEQAKVLCSECEVIKGCLEYALRFEPLGVWGGTTETEREVLRIVKKIVLPIERPQSSSVRRSARTGSIASKAWKLDRWLSEQ